MKEVKKEDMVTFSLFFVANTNNLFIFAVDFYFNNMKKIAKKEVLVSLLPDLTYHTNKATGRKISKTSIVPNDANYPNFSNLSPTKVYDELEKLRSKENAEDSGLMDIADIITDDRKFVRLHQTPETKKLFADFMTIRSAHLFAYLLDHIQIDKKKNVNVVTFDKDILWKKYFFNCDSTYNYAINDLIFGGLISRPKGKRQAMTYYINPNILSCGNVTPESYSGEANKKVKVLTKKELDKKKIDSSILDVLAPQSSKEKNGNTKIGAYVEKDDSRSNVPFFKLFRNKFSKSLLNIKKKSSFKVIACITEQFLPEDEDNARMMREMIITSLNNKKSNCYTLIADILNSGLIYRDSETKLFKFNPNVWFNGNVVKLFDKRFKNRRAIRRDDFLRIQKRRLVDHLADVV